MVVSLGALVAFIAIIDKSILFWTTIVESMSSTVLWMMTVIIKMLSLSLSLLVKTVAVSTPDRTSSSLYVGNRFDGRMCVVVVNGGDICVGSQLDV